MKLTIELESLDDLINLIGLARCVEPKKQEAPKPIAQEPTLSEIGKKIQQDLNERLRAERLEAQKDFLSYPIDILCLKPAAESALRNEGIKDVKDLLFYSTFDLKKLPNVGKATIKTIQSRLGNYGIQLESR